MNKLTFNRKPMPLLAEHRPIFKITQILLILYLSSRGKKSSLIRLHLFSWSLKDEKRKNTLLESADNNKVLFDVWGVDPAVNISLQFAVAEGLIERVNVSYKLSNRGEEFTKRVIKKITLETDYLFLKTLGTKISEGMVQAIVGEWE